jgi:hypothetical protein
MALRHSHRIVSGCPDFLRHVRARPPDPGILPMILLFLFFPQHIGESLSGLSWNGKWQDLRNTNFRRTDLGDKPSPDVLYCIAS